MDSWCYVSGEKAIVSNEMIPSCDTFARSKNSIMGWDFKTPFNFGNNLLVSDQQGLDNQGLEELGFQELIGKQTPDSSVRDSLSRKVYGGKLINPLMGIPNAFPIGEESNSRISSSVVDSNCMGSSFIDLNLGRVADLGDAQNSRISHGTAFVSSSVSSTPLKRVRIGVNSHAAYCQVYGCHKDLSSSKEYHKRHKVCEVHSKTAKVIVNGIEQRFCQQCSRFHLLAEFDDGKRSCRKRLAGHNQRRRKPQAGIHTGRTAVLLQSYNGTAGGRFHGTSGMATSFICQDLLPGGILNHEKYGANDWHKHVKVEDGNDFSPLSTGPFAREQHLHSKPLFPSNNFEKLLPTFHESGASRASSEAEQYPQEFGYPNSSSHPLMQDIPLGNEDFFPFGSATNIQGSSEITDSGCARSLLSSQSQSSSSPSSIKHMASQLLVPGRSTHYSLGQVAEKLVGINNSQASSPSGVSNRFSSSAEGMHMSSILISDSTDAVNFDSMDRIYQGSQFSNAKDRVSYEDDTTMNLLQLSSQLQRVEHQKQSMSVKQGSDAFYCSRIT